MSLFHAREWWSAKLGCAESFSDGSLAVGMIDSKQAGSSKVIIGSLQGRLRIFEPSRYRNEIATALLLECQLEAPILQVELGRLIARKETNGIGISVLHPHKVAVYAVEARIVMLDSLENEIPSAAGDDSSTTHHELLLQYSHRFDQAIPPFIAFSVCIGPFGGARGHDLILVQSIDGRILIYEYDAEAFSRRLQDCLLPGPLIYAAQVDAFITSTSSLHIKCYKYQILAASTDVISTTNSSMEPENPRGAATVAIGSEELPGTTENSMVGNGITSRRILTADWSLNVGEQVHALETARFTPSVPLLHCDVLALGERTLFILSATGVLKATKMLDFRPMSMCVYSRTQRSIQSGSTTSSANILTDEDHDGFIVSTDDARLLVFAGPLNLIWAARGAHGEKCRPLSISTMDVPGAKGAVAGMIVAHTSGHDLAICLRLTLQYVLWNIFAREIHGRYLGTEPSVETDGLKPGVDGEARAAVQGHEYDTMLRELRMLRSGISSQARTPVDSINASVILRVQPPRLLDAGAACSDLDDNMSREQQGECGFSGVGRLYTTRGDIPRSSCDLPCSVTARIFVSYSGTGSLDDVMITIAAPAWTSNVTPNVIVPRLHGKANTPITVQCTLIARPSIPPSELCAKVSAIFIKNDIPRCSSTEFRLPMSLACRLILPPKREATYKLTIQTDREPVLLSSVFSDMFLCESGTESTDLVSSNAVSFAYLFHVQEELDVTESECSTTDPRVPNKAIATILLSRNSGRYRVQSTSMSALWLVLDELAARLKSRWAHSGGIKMAYTEQLPLSDFYATLDRHHNSRSAVRRAEAMLNDSAHQYRIIQKGLLIRFKDSRPANLDKLDLILWQTHSNLLYLASCVEVAHDARDHAGHILACGTQLLLLLMRMRFTLSLADFDVLRSHLSPAVMECNHGSVDDSLSGWEETTDASLTYLLKTSLLKSYPVCGRRNDHEPEPIPKTNIPPVPLAFPVTTDRLKRHVAMVCDRLAHGLTFTSNRGAPQGRASASVR